MVDELVSIYLLERQVEIVQSVCELVHRQLLDGGWVTGKGGNPGQDQSRNAVGNSLVA
jgi:hypothetical protein